jgi:phospholipase C
VKFVLRTLLLFFCSAFAAQAQVSQFQHIIIVFQENRTPDNLFYALCANYPCSTTPNNVQYNIQTANWLDSTSPSGMTQPVGIPLAYGYGIGHDHRAWVKQCDLNTAVNPPQCRMDGAYYTAVKPLRGAFAYVLNIADAKHPNGIITPYLTLATQYGWANYMFQTNQGPSYPAHQYIFGGTSALSAADDAAGTFLSGNINGPSGCFAQDGESAKMIDANGQQTDVQINYALGITHCLTRSTMGDLLDGANIGWKYYGTSANGWVTAPNTSRTICQPDASHLNCTGSKWASSVDLTPAHILRDLGTKGGPCQLRAVSWVIPTGSNSDHAHGSGGPDWVGSIVNALGNSPCKNPDGTSYWSTTAVVVTWDDWGGFYDHVPPSLLPFPEGAYQLGFRVPLLFISAYTPAGYIDNLNHDFGSVLRFIENNFALGEGALGFADSRATTNLSTFYNFSNSPRPFVKLPTAKTALDFLNDKTPPTDPDDY